MNEHVAFVDAIGFPVGTGTPLNPSWGSEPGERVDQGRTRTFARAGLTRREESHVNRRHSAHHHLGADCAVSGQARCLDAAEDPPVASEGLPPCLLGDSPVGVWQGPRSLPAPVVHPGSRTRPRATATARRLGGHPPDCERFRSERSCRRGTPRCGSLLFEWPRSCSRAERSPES
jgi:hypothetical protein